MKVADKWDIKASMKITQSHAFLLENQSKVSWKLATKVVLSPWTWLISELEERISSASFWAVGSTSVWWAVIRYWTSFCSWSLFIWNKVSEMGNRSFTCIRHTHTHTQKVGAWWVNYILFKLFYDFWRLPGGGLREKVLFNVDLFYCAL